MGTDQGEQWELEICHSNPQDELGMTTWETELAFRLAEDQ